MVVQKPGWQAIKEEEKWDGGRGANHSASSANSAEFFMSLVVLSVC